MEIIIQKKNKTWELTTVARQIDDVFQKLDDSVDKHGQYSMFIAH